MAVTVVIVRGADLISVGADFGSSVRAFVGDN